MSADIQTSKTGYLAMSDSEQSNDEDEPYSKEFHEKRANIQNAEPISFSFDEPSTSSSSQLINQAESGLRIVAVRTLLPEEEQIYEDNSVDSHNTAASPSLTKQNENNSINDILGNETRSKVFGIARDDLDENIVEENLLVEMKAADDNTKTTAKRGRKKGYRKPIRSIINQDYLNKSRKFKISKDSLGKDNSSDDATNNESLLQNEDQQPLPIRRTNRRKSVLRANDDSGFEFVDTLEDRRKNPSTNPKLTIDEKMQLDQQKAIVKSIPNPNVSLMEKVSFLRVSVDYMLKRLGRKKIVFYKNMSLKTLCEKYEEDNN